jgi:aubergine-like protein
VNPFYGTLINTDVVSNYYDFYLIAQNCNRGTAKPTYYKVIYNDSQMEEGVL